MAVKSESAAARAQRDLPVLIDAFGRVLDEVDQHLFQLVWISLEFVVHQFIDSQLKYRASPTGWRATRAHRAKLVRQWF